MYIYIVQGERKRRRLEIARNKPSYYMWALPFAFSTSNENKNVVENVMEGLCALWTHYWSGLACPARQNLEGRFICVCLWCMCVCGWDG